MDFFGELAANDLMWAIVNWGADPELIEDEETASYYANLINSATIRREITDGDEFVDACEKLDLTAYDYPRRIYSFVNGGEGVINFYGDREHAL